TCFPLRRTLFVEMRLSPRRIRPSRSSVLCRYLIVNCNPTAVQQPPLSDKRQICSSRFTHAIFSWPCQVGRHGRNVNDLKEFGTAATAWTPEDALGSVWRRSSRLWCQAPVDPPPVQTRAAEPDIAVDSESLADPNHEKRQATDPYPSPSCDA